MESKRVQDIVEGRHRIPVIDLVKYICAGFVIFYHTANLGHYSGIGEITRLVIWSISRFFSPVEYFFAISSFLFFRKYLALDSSIRDEYFLKYCKRLVKLYLLWALFYLQSITHEWTGRSILYNCMSLIKQLFFTGYSIHTWYILALLYGMVFLFILLKYFGKSVAIVCVTIIGGISLLGSSYYYFYPNSYLIDFFFKFFGSVNILRAVPYIYMGAILAEDVSTKKDKYTINRVKLYSIAWICSGMLSLIEIQFTNEFGLAKNNNSTLLSFFSVLYLLKLLLCLNNIEIRISNIANVLGSICSFVYFSHILIRDLLIRCFGLFCNITLENGFALWGLTLLISTAIGLLLYEIKIHKKRIDLPYTN